MRKGFWKKSRMALVILVLTGAAGVWLGSALVPDAKSVAQKSEWASLGAPPEGAVEIAGEFVCENENGVVVQSSSGARYIRCPAGWEEWNQDYGDPWHLETCVGDPPTASNPGFASLPRPVEDCGLRYAQEWAVSETVYVALDDGSIWEWGFSYGVGTPIRYWIGGLVAGLAIGIVIVVVLWRTRWKYDSATEEPGSAV